MTLFRSCFLALFLLLGLMHPASAGPYDRIDLGVVRLDGQSFGSIAELSKKLSSLASNDREKARAIFVWLAHNIAYDGDAWTRLDGHYPDNVPEVVFKTRTAVCNGYAKLFVLMARQMGLEAEYVTGYIKGAEGGDSFIAKNYHAWNAVKLDGKWQVLDATWAAGYPDKENHFVRKFNDRYFLTPPVLMMLDHYPSENRWQLLQHPLTRTQFEQMPHIGPAFFAFGLHPETHTTHTITSSRELVQIPISTATPAHFGTVLEDKSRRPLNHRVFIQNKGLNTQIRVILPQAGEYYLRLFVKTPEQRNYAWAITYRIVSTQAQANELSFPTVYPEYVGHQAQLYSPLSGKLTFNKTYRFQIQVPGALKVAIDGQELSQEKDMFTGEVTMKTPQKQVTLYALFAGNSNYWSIVTYDLGL